MKLFQKTLLSELAYYVSLLHGNLPFKGNVCTPMWLCWTDDTQWVSQWQISKAHNQGKVSVSLKGQCCGVNWMFLTKVTDEMRIDWTIFLKFQWRGERIADLSIFQKTLKLGWYSSQCNNIWNAGIYMYCT